MNDTKEINNDSIALNNIMLDRLNADHIDLLDAEFYGEMTLIFENGMIKDYKILKRRRVKR